MGLIAAAAVVAVMGLLVGIALLATVRHHRRRPRKW